MKCPICETERAYRNTSPSCSNWMIRLLGFIPMHCHRCYRRYHLHWFQTIGKQITLPARTGRVEPSRQ